MDENSTVTVTLTRQQVRMLIDSIDMEVWFAENKRVLEDASERLHIALEVED